MAAAVVVTFSAGEGTGGEALRELAPLCSRGWQEEPSRGWGLAAGGGCACPGRFPRAYEIVSELEKRSKKQIQKRLFCSYKKE